MFAGTFNPFTIGHARLVERALGFADKVIVAFGYNENKANAAIEESLNRVRRLYSGREDVEVTTYSGLTADYARECGADFLLRGVRNAIDFEYERNLADANLKVLGMDTVILVAEPEYSYISSSMLRELEHNGRDISGFLPPLDTSDSSDYRN